MNLGEEDEATEFKESLGQLDEGLKALSAMLNRNGHGAVYYGVKDDGTVCGMTVSRGTLVNIRARIKEKIEPQIMPVIEDIVDESGRHYVRVSANGYDKPYSFDGRYFLRTAASNEKVSTHLLRQMLVSGSTDVISQMESMRQDVTFNGLVALLAGRGMHVRNEKSFYQSAGLLTHDGKYNLTAFLLSDQNNLSPQVVKFNGTDKSEMTERMEYGGQCLFLAILQSFDYVTSLISTRVELADGVRHETALFDRESFREAWVNACLHNRWSEHIPPAVHIFDDRVEIISYGTIPYDLSQESFYAGTSLPVNNRLFALASMAGISEQTGHGIPIIVTNYGKNAFTFTDNITKVTLRYAFRPGNTAMRQEAQGACVEQLTEKQRRIYEYLRDHPNATVAQAAAATEVSLSGAKKITQRLQEIGLITHEGSRRDGTWVVW